MSKGDRSKRPTGRAQGFADDARITMVVKDNPCKPGTRAHKLYAALLKSKTVGEYRAAVKAAKLGAATPYLRDQVARRFAEVKS